MPKTLTAYFSASHQTERLAKTIAKAAHADLLEIVPEIPYTSQDLNWMDSSSRSSLEMKDPASRPALAHPLLDVSEYDTILIGFPIWWYTAPHIILSFLESADFAGKTVVPFATSGGSPMGKSLDDMKKCCSGQTIWKEGKRMSPAESEASVKQWLKKIGVVRE